MEIWKLFCNAKLMGVLYVDKKAFNIKEAFSREIAVSSLKGRGNIWREIGARK